MKVRSNLDDFIVSAKWQIEKKWGLAAYAAYCIELEESKTVPFSQIGIGLKRKASKPAIITRENIKLVGGRYMSSPETTPAGSIAHIKIQGVMRTSDGLSSRGAESIAEDINAAQNNQNIIGAIIDVNSGGGEGMAATVVHNALKAFTKPKIALVNLAASGGYKSILSADRIYMSSAEAEVGSVGTMVTVNRRFLEDFRKNYVTYYAAQSTNKNRSWERLINNNDPSALIEDLSEYNELFQQEVMSFRTIRGTAEQVENALSGEMFFAKQAIELGLADGIMGFNESVEAIRQAADTNNNFSLKNQRVMEKGLMQKVANFLGVGGSTEQELQQGILTKVETTTEPAPVQTGPAQVTTPESVQGPAPEPVNPVTAEQVQGLIARIEQLEATNKRLTEEVTGIRVGKILNPTGQQVAPALPPDAGKFKTESAFDMFFATPEKGVEFKKN